jgi:hypothetical protein
MKVDVYLGERCIQLINEWGDDIFLEFPNDKSWEKIVAFVNDREKKNE